MKKACVVVDYQNWFARKTTKELYVQGGEGIATRINSVMSQIHDEGWIIIASKEQHPIGNISFASNFVGKRSVTEVGPNDPRAWITLEEVYSWKKSEWFMDTAGFTKQELIAYLQMLWGRAMLWPNHCQKDTEWAEFFSDFAEEMVDFVVIKGDRAIEHPYSAFSGIEKESGRSLDKILEDEGVWEIDVVGLATDYCVQDTILDLANTWKYRINAILSWMRAVAPDSEKMALNAFQKVGVTILP